MCAMSVAFSTGLPLLSKRGIYSGKVMRHEARVLSDMFNTHKIMSLKLLLY